MIFRVSNINIPDGSYYCSAMVVIKDGKRKFIHTYWRGTPLLLL